MVEYTKENFCKHVGKKEYEKGKVYFCENKRRCPYNALFPILKEYCYPCEIRTYTSFLKKAEPSVLEALAKAEAEEVAEENKKPELPFKTFAEGLHMLRDNIAAENKKQKETEANP